MCGTGLDLQINIKSPLVYISNDEGQIYSVDWSLKASPENLTGNIKRVYNLRYFRPVISFHFSPFYDFIFLTLHDYHFCLWSSERSKPIFISPNLKKSFYTSAKFSPSRPSVVFFTRNNGAIDIWDFLDESHKPSVKETFIKEQITSIEIFKYFVHSDTE